MIWLRHVSESFDVILLNFIKLRKNRCDRAQIGIHLVFYFVFFIYYHYELGTNKDLYTTISKSDSKSQKIRIEKSLRTQSPDSDYTTIVKNLFIYNII